MCRTSILVCRVHTLSTSSCGVFCCIIIVEAQTQHLCTCKLLCGIIMQGTYVYIYYAYTCTCTYYALHSLLLGDTNDSDLFFVLKKGRPVEKSMELIRSINRQFKVELLTATEARKVVETEALNQLSPGDGRALVEQLTYSQRTHRRYYEQGMLGLFQGR